MKKTIKNAAVLLLTVLVLFSIVSCELIAGKTPEQTTPQSTTPEESTPFGTTPTPIPDQTTPPQSVTTTPVVTDPIVTDPIVTDPIVTDPIVTDPIVTDPIETTPPEKDPDDEPLIDLKGYTYRAYVRSNNTTGNSMEDGNPSFYCEDFWVDPSYGEPEDAISYCVYLRNSTIEREYNVKICQVNQKGNMAEELASFYLGGDCFDLTIILAKSAAQAATMGLLQDLNSLPALLLDQPAYDQNSIRELSIAGKLYYLSGDMNISTMDCLMPTVVNVERYEMFADAFVEYFENPLYSNVYNVVSSGEWTTSTLLAMAELASTDADTSDGPLGASRWDDVGYFQYAASTLYYFYGAGGRLIEINENGEPEFVIQKEQNQEIFEYLFYTMNKYNRDVPLPYGYSSARRTHFITNQSALFTDMTLWDIRKDLYVNCEFAYGILPTPTYNEGDDYRSVVHFSNMAHLWAIPTLCGDMFNAQLMMATMAACSDITLTDSTMNAYYYRTLYFAVAPDPDARRSLDIIRNSTVYDIGLLYDWGGWVYELEKLGEMPSNNYGSLVSTMPFNAIPLLRKTIEQFENPVFPY